MSIFAAFFALPLALTATSHAYPIPGGPTAPSQRITVILDPGHGGDDLGAHIDGVIEKDLCLSFAKRLKADLESRGISVQLTRESDVNPPLDQRVADSGHWARAIFVSLHINQAWHLPKPHGIIVYSYGREEIAQKRPGLHLPHLAPPPAYLQQKSARLGQELARAFRDGRLRTQGVIRTDYYVLKNPFHPSVLVELGFVTNPSERRKLSNEKYQEKLAKILSRGIDTYLSLSEPSAMTVRR